MTKLRGNPWAVLVVVSLGFFMTLLDLTIVNIAIPNMIDKLHASLDDVLWVLNAYALVLAVLVITAGRLGDLLGPRTMFVAGIAVFTVASAACGFAPDPAWLIAFRAARHAFGQERGKMRIVAEDGDGGPAQADQHGLAHRAGQTLAAIQAEDDHCGNRDVVDGIFHDEDPRSFQPSKDTPFAGAFSRVVVSIEESGLTPAPLKPP